MQVGSETTSAKYSVADSSDPPLSNDPGVPLDDQLLNDRESGSDQVPLRTKWMVLEHAVC